MKQKKEFKIGTLDRYGVYIRAELRTENTAESMIELSICGHTQYRRNCDFNMAGQIQDELRASINRIKFSAGWNKHKLIELLDIWDRWHLNGMRAGCEHQRENRWNERPLNAYDNFVGNTMSWNMLAWVRPTEHSEGLLTKPCPVCGYKYGTAWLHENLPDTIINWFNALPEQES